MLTRRQLAAWLAAAPGALRADAPAVDSIRRRLPPSAPEGVASIIANALARTPASINTDWFGTLLTTGLLEWGRRGIPEASTFARQWLAHHLDSREVAPYSGHGSRTVRAGGIPITTYCGHFGLGFPAFKIARQFGDARARQVCLDVASIILHQTARNRFGMVAHADNDDFVIPDTCFFTVVPLMMAAALDPQRGWPYREQAVYQLRTNIDVFLVRETGLAKTILLNSGQGKTYWTRASGWLMWAITGMLRYLPPGDRTFAGFVADLRILAGGVARAQGPSGALPLYLDQPGSPAETSGTAMCMMCMHEAIRRGWLPSTFNTFVDAGWKFVRDHIDSDGRIRGVYTGWAVPAEKGEILMDHVSMEWIPGLMLSAANEMTSERGPQG